MDLASFEEDLITERMIPDITPRAALDTETLEDIVNQENINEVEPGVPDDGSELNIGWTEDDELDLHGDIKNIDTVCATEIPRKVFHIRLVQAPNVFNSILFIGIEEGEDPTTQTYSRSNVPDSILAKAKILREDLGNTVYVVKEFIDSDDTLGLIRYRIATTIGLPSAYITMWAPDNDGFYSLLGTKYYYNLTTIQKIQERLTDRNIPLSDIERQNLTLYLDELKQRNLSLRKKAPLGRGRKKAEKNFEDTIEPYKQAIYNPDPYANPVPDPYFSKEHIAQGEIFLIKEDDFILEDYNISTTTINAASIIDFVRWVSQLDLYTGIRNPTLSSDIKALLTTHMIKYWPNYQEGDQAYSVTSQTTNKPIGPVHTVMRLYNFTESGDQRAMERAIREAVAQEKKIYDEALEKIAPEMRYAKDLIWRPDLPDIQLDSCSITETVIHVNYGSGTTTMAAASAASAMTATSARATTIAPTTPRTTVSATAPTLPSATAPTTAWSGDTAAGKAAATAGYIARMGLPSGPVGTTRGMQRGPRGGRRTRGLGPADFVDLLKIFDNFPLSPETPFIKFRGDESNEGFHKVHRSIVDSVSSDELKRWISNKPTTTKTADGIKYTVFGKGLSLKTEIYRKNGEAKYATIFITRDGKIEIKAAWDEDSHADLTDIVKMLEACRYTVQLINTIDYHLPRTNRNRLIDLPNPEFYRMASNTKIVLINAISQFTTKSPIDFFELNELARAFHKSFASVMATDIGFEGIGADRKVVARYQPLLKLRYNRISNFENMSTIQKFVYDLVQQLGKRQVNDYYGNETGKKQLAKLGVLYFKQRGEEVTEDQVFADLPPKDRLVKSTLKHPGVDLKIRPTERPTVYKIYILGAKGVNQMRRIHFFITKLVSLYFDLKDRPANVGTTDFYWRRLNATGAPDNIAATENLAAEILDKEEKERRALTEAKETLIEDLKSGEIGTFVPSEEEEDDISLSGSESEGEYILDENDIQYEYAQYVKQGLDARTMVDAIGDLIKTGIPAEPDHDEDEDEDDLEEAEREIEERERLASAAARSKAKRRMGQAMSKIAYLEAYDPDIVPKGSDGYSRKCQPVGRHPIVLSNEEYDQMVEKLRNEAATLAATAPAASKEKLQSIESVTGDQRVISYRGNRFMCPLGFCHTDHEPLTTMAAITVHKEIGHNVSVQQGDKPIPGFVKGKTEKGFCMPCCFKRSGPAWKKSIDECLVGQGTASSAPTEVGLAGQSHISDDQMRYVLKAKKKQIRIDAGRLGFLPEYLDLLLNAGKNCSTAAPTGSTIGEGFDCYVRKGMPSNEVNRPNTFLNVMGDLYEPVIPGSEVRKQLIDSLRNDPDIFEGLMEGSLKIIFTERPTDTTIVSSDVKDRAIQDDPEENFISFLENQPINENFLWDFVTMPGVIKETGFNLFIIEALAAKNKGITDYIFTCPNGFEMKRIFDPERPSLIVFKYHNHYEPIYRVTVQNRIMHMYKEFDSSHPIVQTLIDMMNRCRPYDDKRAFTELSKFYARIKEKPIQFIEGQTAEEIYMLLNETQHDFPEITEIVDIEIEPSNLSQLGMPEAREEVGEEEGEGVGEEVGEEGVGEEVGVGVGVGAEESIVSAPISAGQIDNQTGGLKMKPDPSEVEVIGQIVDDYNKTIYLVLKNGLKLPVEPSRKINRLPQLDFDDIPHLDYVTTVQILLDLYNFYRIRGHILQNVVNGEGTIVHGILLDTGLMVPVKPISKSELEEIGTITSNIDPNLAISQKDLDDTVNFMTMEAVDRMIQSGQIDEDEERVISNARRFFETETYQRIRFELSKWLNLDEQLMNEIEQIIYSPDPLTVKRRAAYDWLYDVISDMSTSDGRDGEDYLLGYHTPNVRRVCLNMTNCGSDPHCQMTPEGTCKLFLPRTNLINGKPNLPYYSHLLADELIRNNFKRNEILDDRIDNYISRIARTVRPNEVLFSDSNPDVTLATIRELYAKGIDWERKREEFYTVKNPESYNIKFASEDQDLGLDLAATEGQDLQDPITRRGAEPGIVLDTIDTHFAQALEPMSGFRQVVWEGTEDLIYEHIARALHQKAEYLGEVPTETAGSIKRRIVDFLGNGMNPEILPDGQEGRQGWQLSLDVMKKRYPSEFQHIYNFKEAVINDDEADPSISLETEIMSRNHRLNEHDLAIISRLFGIKFITLRHQLLHHEDKTSKRLNCLATTQTLEPWTILLYYVGRDKWRVIVNMNKTPGNSMHRYQYIWNQELPPNYNLPYNFYNFYYLPQCGITDQKRKIDPANTTLLLEEKVRGRLPIPRMRPKVPVGNVVNITSPRRTRVPSPIIELPSPRVTGAPTESEPLLIPAPIPLGIPSVDVSELTETEVPIIPQIPIRPREMITGPTRRRRVPPIIAPPRREGAPKPPSPLLERLPALPARPAGAPTTDPSVPLISEVAAILDEVDALTEAGPTQGTEAGPTQMTEGELTQVTDMTEVTEVAEEVPSHEETIEEVAAGVPEPPVTQAPQRRLRIPIIRRRPTRATQTTQAMISPRSIPPIIPMRADSGRPEMPPGSPKSPRSPRKADSQTTSSRVIAKKTSRLPLPPRITRK